jgi:hypothetical protein
MANKFTDSFSNYSTTTQLNAKWNGGGSGGTRTVAGTYAIGAASQGMQLVAGTLLVNLPNYAHYFAGIRQKWVSTSGTPNNSLFYFVDSAAVIFDVRFETGGTISIRRGSTVLNTSTLTIAVTQTHYYELELLLGTSGIMKLYVDGILYCTFAGNTSSTTNLISQFGCGAGGGGGCEVWLADCYIDDDTGTVCNTRQGDTTVNSYRVNAAGSYAQFNRGGTDLGANYLQLQKALADGTSYNVSNIVNNRDSFKMGTVPAPSVALLGARLWANVQKDSFGPRQMALTQISGATDFSGASQAVNGPGYGWLTEDMSLDKATGALWASVTPLNSAEMGYKITV